MNKYLKIGLLGLLTWLIPFVVSCFFYSRTGEPLFDIFLLKTIMIVLFSAFGAYLLITYFKGIGEGFVSEGIIVGTVWLLMNWLLDIVILLPLSKMGMAAWFTQIGLRYLIIPIMSISFGFVLQMIVTE